MNKGGGLVSNKNSEFRLVELKPLWAVILLSVPVFFRVLIERLEEREGMSMNKKIKKSFYSVANNVMIGILSPALLP